MSGRDIIDFIKEVENRPCIYNVTMPEYSNRNETKRAWCEIAEVMECTENECKEKWRRIRIAFMRSLKHMKSTSSSARPYYLYDNLSFLLPFIKHGEVQVQELEDSAMTLESLDFSEDEELQVGSKKTRKIEVDSDETNGHNVIYRNDRIVDKIDNESYKSDRQRRFVEYDRKRKKIENMEDNPRKMFLLSILPDVESFSEEEMRTFRRNVVSCIDNIIDRRKKNI